MKQTIPDHPKFFIITQPRTGSNNLSNALNAHAWLKTGNELLHPSNGLQFEKGLINGCQSIIDEDHYPGNKHWSGRYPDSVLFAVVDKLLEDLDGFKIHTSHIQLEKFESLIDHYTGFKYIFTERRSKFDQAMSNFIAMKSMVWHANDIAKKGLNNTNIRIEINPHSMVSWINTWVNELAAIKGFLQDAGIEYKEVVLEAFFTGTFEEKVARINDLFEYLGVPRLGMLESQPERAAVYAKLKLYFNPERQKVTKEETVKDLVVNYQALLDEYNRHFPA
jgi:LPS sulfotransferase NodH